jgi:hypothetical protein
MGDAADDGGGGASPPGADADVASAPRPLFAGDLTKVRVVLRVRPLLRREYGYPLAAERQADTRCVHDTANARLRAGRRRTRVISNALRRALCALRCEPRGSGCCQRTQTYAPCRATRDAPCICAFLEACADARPRVALRSLRLFQPRGEVLSEADAVLDETSTQDDVRFPCARSACALRQRFADAPSPFDRASQVYATVADVVAGALRGCNGTIFAYGQTGTGKTYTMLGATPPEAL